MSTPGENLDFKDDRSDEEDEALDVDVTKATDEEKERASRMGWTDEDKYTGDPERWVDAKTFIERGETILPILKDRLRKQDDDLKNIRGELRTVIQNQGEFERTTRERVQTEFEDRKRKAVAEADTDAYDEVHKEEQRWYQAQRPPAAAPSEGAQEGNAILTAWNEQNPWFGTDPELSEFADDLAGVISKRQPHLAGTAELLEKVASRTREVYPDKFTNPNRQGKGAVEGSTGPAGGGKGRKKSYADLPGAAKTKCDEYVANKWVASRDEYVDTYFGDDEQ